MAERHAYFAGGCFWCITPIFYQIGARKVVSGYSGGQEANPSYEDVKHQRTGHRETINIIYDDERITYDQLLDIYLGSIDPYDGEGQFIDRGHSYTCAVYYQTEAEKILTEQKITALEAQSGMTVAVAIEPFLSFYDAEEYHQDYFKKNPEAFEKEMIESGRKK